MENLEAFEAYCKENDIDFETSQDDYLCLTDSEADDMWDEYMDSYIDDCVLSELPAQYRNYFDREAFKNDCSYDGRGHSLASYDGEEHEFYYDGVWYYIYRTN